MAGDAQEVRPGFPGGRGPAGRETGKPVARVARDLVRLRRENAELQMRCDVLKRSVALWIHDAMRSR